MRQHIQQSSKAFVSLCGQQLNISILALAFIIYYLTHWFAVWVYWAIGEIWYLTLTMHDGPLDRLKCWLHGKLPWLLQLKMQEMLSCLVLAGGILYVVVGRGIRIVISGRYINETYQRWEIAALIWNVAFAVLSEFWITRHVKSLRERTLSLVHTITVLWMAKRALDSLPRGNHMEHFLYVFSIALVYLLVGIIEFANGKNAENERRRSMEMMLFADLPTVLAMLTLILFLGGKADTPYLSIFLAGFLAFQFIASLIVIIFVSGRTSTLFLSRANVDEAAQLRPTMRPS